MSNALAVILGLALSGPLESPCDAADECAQLGLKTHEAGEFGEARQYFSLACDLGSGFGCRAAGANYRAGLGGPENVSEAIDYFKRGCDLGDSEACHETGFTYEFYGEPNLESALSSYAAACKAGQVKSCEAGVARAMVLERPEWKGQVGLVRENCRRGDLSSCGTLGAALSQGFGVERDPVRARQFYRKACGEYHPWCERMWLVPGGDMAAAGLAGAVAAVAALSVLAALRFFRVAAYLLGFLSVSLIMVSGVNLYFRMLFGPFDTVLWLVLAGCVALGFGTLLRWVLRRGVVRRGKLL